MPIRFPCPACHQPLEVDDDWGNQTVACPYCRRVVTAPASSSWSASNVPVATPARPEPGGFPPPPPPPGYAPPAPPGGSSRAAGALVLAIVGAGLSVLAVLFWMGALGLEVQKRVGANPTEARYQEVTQEMMSRGEIPRPAPITYLVLLAAISSLAGLVRGVGAAVQQEQGRGMAITACILGAMFLVCPLMWFVLLLGSRPA